MRRILLAGLVLLCGAGTAQATTYYLAGEWTGSGGTLLSLKQELNSTSVTWFARSADGKDFAHDFSGAIDGDYITGDFTDRPGYNAYNTGTITARIFNNCRFQITDVQYHPIASRSVASAASGGETFKKNGCETQLPSVKAFPARGKKGRAIPVRFTVKDNSGEVRLAVALWKGNRRISRKDYGFVKADGSTRTVTFAFTKRGTFEVWVIAVDRSGNRFADRAEVVVTD